MPKKKSKKIIRTAISNRLRNTFGDLQETLGKRKFKRNIKKASKALATKLKEFGPEDKSKQQAVKIKEVEVTATSPENPASSYN